MVTTITTHRKQLRATRIKHVFNTQSLVALCIFIVLVAIRISSMYSRVELHSDETFSVMLAQHNRAYIDPLPADTVLTGADIKGLLITEHPLSQDLVSLWHNNLDIPHASLYYMALRIAICAMPGNFEASQVAIYGGWLNILFFAISFWGLFKILTTVMGKRIPAYISAVGLLAAFATKSSIECTLMVREYQMAQMFVILTTLYIMKIALPILEKNAAAQSQKHWIILTIVTAGTMSTGYLNSVYLLILFGALCAISMFHKKPIVILQCIAVALASIALSWMAYSGFFNFLIHGNVHTERSFSSFASIPQLIFITTLTNNTFTLTGVIIFSIALIAVLLSKESRSKIIMPRHAVWLPCLALLAMIIIEYGSLLKAERYIYPLLPIVALIIPIVFNMMPKYKDPMAIFFGVYMLMISLLIPVKPSYGWLNMRSSLQQGAVLYRLNANELPQIAPVLNDTAHYHLTNNVKYLTDTTLPIVSRITPPVDSISATLPMTGPLKQHIVHKIEHNN